jgi:hypothetical protein
MASDTVSAGKVVWGIGAQLLALAVLLLTVYLIAWAASKAWKKGQESSYRMDGNK